MYAAVVVQVVQSPQVGVKRPVLCYEVQHGAGVLNRRDDLAPVADDVAVLKEAFKVVGPVGRHPSEFKIVEALNEVAPLLTYDRPAEPRAEDRLGQLFKITVIAVGRDFLRPFQGSSHFDALRIRILPLPSIALQHPVSNRLDHWQKCQRKRGRYRRIDRFWPVSQSCYTDAQ